jgi:hypothetical protein
VGLRIKLGISDLDFEDPDAYTLLLAIDLVLPQVMVALEKKGIEVLEIWEGSLDCTAQILVDFKGDREFRLFF